MRPEKRHIGRPLTAAVCLPFSMQVAQHSTRMSDFNVSRSYLVRQPCCPGPNDGMTGEGRHVIMRV
jgi:hypothetical protein